METHGTERPREAPTSAKIASELRWHGGGQIAGELAFYVMVIVLGALLEPRAFGIVALGMVVVRVATLLAQEGTGGSIIAAADLARADVYSTLRLNLALGAGLTAVVVVAAEPLTRTFASGADANVLRVLAAIVLLASAGAIPAALLKRALDFRRFSLVSGSAAVITALSAIVAAFAGAGVWALVVRQVLYHGLVAIFAWTSARSVLRTLPARHESDGRARRPPGRLPFFVIAASTLTAMTLDNLVVGAVTDATQLGLYSLAFTLGFAPLTQLSWRIGQVLFPAAAATADLEAVGRRTVRVVRVTALLLLPFVPVAVAIAPALLPGVFGDEWSGMVAPFQLLLAVGVLHAVLNTIGESLSGTGNVRFRAWIDTLWALGTLALVGVLASLWGIRGAALAHLIAFVPLAAAYALAGARRIGSDARALWTGTRDIALPALAQTAVTVAMLEALGDAGPWRAGIAAALGGLLVLLLLLWRAPSRPLADGRAIIVMMLPRRTAAGA